MTRNYFTPEQAAPKIRQYCAYQERSHKEVMEKLFSFGLTKDEAGEILVGLIEENYINEERFAIHYAGGKFRMLHWGKIKIRLALKQKEVSDYCIKKALDAIDEDQYLSVFQKLSKQKLDSLKSEKNIFTKKKKLQDYLIGKGYENFLIREVVDAIGRKN